MKLRDYQIEIAEKAIAILKEKGIVYLAMETRCGKTLTALEVCNQIGYENILFVTKKKAIKSIESDAINYPGLNVTVINYESVHKLTGKYDIAIVDESHSLGAYPRASKRYRDLKKIVFNLPVILMSATPSPESYSQLFHQFTINKYHKWNLARNFYHWGTKYVDKKITYVYNREVPNYSEAKEELVKQATDEYIINFTQKEAGIEKRVNENILYCDMSPNTARIIEVLNRDFVSPVSENLIILADTAVKVMQKTHQLSSGTVKDEDGNYHIIDDSKAVFIKDNFKGKKIAIFYKFIAESILLKKVFENWTDSPETFQENNDHIFLGQFQSAREGIRLDTADAIIFFNIDFSFLSYEQSKNRIVSKERTKDADLYFIFNRIGIEPKIYGVVKNKSDYTLNYYRKDYARKRHTKEDSIESPENGLVRSQNNSGIQKRLAGFDVDEVRKNRFH